MCQVPANAGKRVVTQLYDVKARVEEQLGGPDGFSDDGGLSVVETSTEEHNEVGEANLLHTQPRYRTFLCVAEDNLVAGYLTVEPVAAQKVIVLPVPDGQQQHNTVEQLTYDATRGVAEPDIPVTGEVCAEGWYMGVRHIWVAVSHRRKGVAAALVRAAQRAFAVGGGCEIAFSQPTVQGTRLAAALLGNKRHILAYR